MGGLSASYFHRELIEYPQVDFVMRGDSTEPPLHQLLLALRDGTSLAEVPNLTWKESGRVRVNPHGFVPESLDYVDLRPDLFVDMVMATLTVTASRGIETAKVLVAAGAKVNATNGGGQTALHGSAQLGWTQFVRFLAAQGAKVDVKDGRGATPLDIALGRSGTTGRAGVAGAEAHPETAAALRELIAAPAARP